MEAVASSTYVGCGKFYVPYFSLALPIIALGNHASGGPGLKGAGMANFTQVTSGLNFEGVRLSSEVERAMYMFQGGFFL